MNKANTPFRYDYVGSFLRPAGLKQARADFQNGKIGADELKAAEDQAIRELVAKQQSVGYHVITDGEFRRATWHLDFMWGFHGVGHSRTEKGLPFHGENAMLDDTYLTGEVGVDSHPFVEHFRFVKALEDENTVAKLTIPAPAQFLEQMVMPFAMDPGAAPGRQRTYPVRRVPRPPAGRTAVPCSRRRQRLPARQRIRPFWRTVLSGSYP